MFFHFDFHFVVRSSSSIIDGSFEDSQEISSFNVMFSNESQQTFSIITDI